MWLHWAVRKNDVNIYLVRESKGKKSELKKKKTILECININIYFYKSNHIQSKENNSQGENICFTKKDKGLLLLTYKNILKF